MQPGRHDYLDTGLGISIWASHKLHRAASGWWWMVMNRKDSILGSPSYHRQGFPGNCQLGFERCPFSVSNLWRLVYDFHSLKRSSTCHLRLYPRQIILMGYLS